MIPLVPVDDNVDNRLELINQLKLFLVTAPDGWTDQDGSMKQHSLPTGESISCVKWNDSFFISGTDIVRCLVFRFLAFGRPVQNPKKFEEGVFSDLRNLKPGTDAILEEPKSDFLELLFKNNCIRTQKKQKVFHWFAVPHDRLFLDALERDLKREKMGIEPTSSAVSQPAVTISLDTTQALFDEFRKAMLSELNLDALLVNQDDIKHSPISSSSSCSGSETSLVATTVVPRADLQKASTIFGQFSLFEGSPSYKQRRRRNANNLSQQQQPDTCNNNSSNSKAVSAKNQHPYHHQNNNNDDKDALWSSDSDPACTNNNNNLSENMELPRSFDCPIPSCQKYFKRLEHMKRHLRTHTMERPYLCDLCGKRFSRSDNLAQHKKTHKKHHQQKQQQQLKQKQQQQMKEGDDEEEEDDDDEDVDMDYNLDNENEEEDDGDSDYGMKKKNSYGSGVSRRRRQRHHSLSDSPKQKNDRKYSKPLSINTTSAVIHTASPYYRGPLIQQHRRRFSHNEFKSTARSNMNSNNNNNSHRYHFNTNWSCNNNNSSNNNNNSNRTSATFRENYLKPCLSLSTTPSSSCHSSPSCLSENVPANSVKVEPLELFYDITSGAPLPSVADAETTNHTTVTSVTTIAGNDYITSSLDHSQIPLPSLHHHHHQHDYTTADWSHPYSTSSSPRFDGLVLNYQFDDSPYIAAAAAAAHNGAYYDTSSQDLLYPIHHSASASPLPPLMVPFSSAAASPTDSCSDYLPTMVPSFYYSSPTMTPSDALVFK